MISRCARRLGDVIATAVICALVDSALPKSEKRSFLGLDSVSALVERIKAA